MVKLKAIYYKYVGRQKQIWALFVSYHSERTVYCVADSPCYVKSILVWKKFIIHGIDAIRISKNIIACFWT